MKKSSAHLTKLLGAIIVFYASQALAQAPAEDPFSTAVRSAILLGCLPNAMDMHPFTPDREKELEASGITLTTDIPQDTLGAMLTGLTGPDIQTAVYSTFPRQIAFASAPQMHMCRIGIANVDPAKARAIVTQELLAKGSPWKLKEHSAQGAIQFDSYVWELPGKPVNAFINISGPAEISNNGHGLQLLISVALVKKDN